MAQTYGDWTFTDGGDPGATFAYWQNTKTGEVAFNPPDAALKAAARGPDAVQNLMWMTGGDFSRVKELGLLGDNADWNALGEMGAAQQAAGDSDFSVKEIALPTALVLGGALLGGPALESAFGLGGGEALAAGAAGDMFGSGAIYDAGVSGLAGGAGAVSGGGAGAAALAGGSAADKLSDALGISKDTLSLLGIAGATGLGVYGADQKADALTDIANQLRADRKPFLDQSLAWLNDPNAYLSGPGKASMDAVLRSLSVRGNPTGLPSSMALAGDYGLRSWLDAVTNMGSLGTGGEGVQASLGAGAADADASGLNAIGWGLNQATQPQDLTLAQLIKGMRSPNGKSLI